MADPKQKLTETQVREAGLADWRQVFDRIGARFATGDFATGLGLVNAIGAAAEEADHHPDLTLTYPEVTVWLSSHDVGGLTSRDVDLARTISGLAAEAGASADPSSLQRLEFGLDTPDSPAVHGFYAALFGGSSHDQEVVAPHGDYPTVWFQDAEPDAEPPKQRWHLDVWVPHDQGEARVQAVLDAGGTLVDDSEAPAFWVLADVQGNRSCICTPLTRDWGGDTPDTSADA